MEKSAEDIRKTIKAAKLHESELTEISQVLRFCTYKVDNLKLMQLDPELLKQIEDGCELVFKGDPHENAVLCSRTRTYDLKEAETSNSLLLVPDLLFATATAPNESQTKNDSIDVDSDTSLDKSNNSLNKSNLSDDGEKLPRNYRMKDVLNTYFTYLEPKICKPRLWKTLKLLDSTRYKGPELEYKVDKALLVTYERLEENVQASDKELRDELLRLMAINIDGYYRLLDFDYEFRVLSYMLDLIEENSWSLDRIIKNITVDSIKALAPIEIIEVMFASYTEESDFVDGLQYYRYKEDKVCKFLANVLLKNAGKFNFNDFMQAWQDSVPEGMVVKEVMLSGVALIDKSTTPQVIWGFTETSLPEDINERFQVLFRTKSKWTVDEISPYIQCYTTEKMNVNGLLTKYARASTVNGIRVFSSKHGR